MAATPLELVYSPTYPTVEGVVLDSHDQPVANVHIMGIPEERYRNRGAYSSHFFTADTNPKGEFTYPYALPGEYTLLAFQFDLFSGEELPATDVLLKKHGGQVIKLAEKEHYRVVLHLIDLEER